MIRIVATWKCGKHASCLGVRSNYSKFRRLKKNRLRNGRIEWQFNFFETPTAYIKIQIVMYATKSRFRKFVISTVSIGNCNGYRLISVFFCFSNKEFFFRCEYPKTIRISNFASFPHFLVVHFVQLTREVSRVSKIRVRTCRL
jgi:hypothetical protein